MSVEDNADTEASGAREAAMSTDPSTGADLFYATAAAQDPKLIAGLLRDREIDFGCRAVQRRRPDGRIEIDLFATEAKLRELRALPGLELTVGRNASAQGRLRQQEVSRSDRFEAGRITPRGFGRKVRPQDRG